VFDNSNAGVSVTIQAHRGTCDAVGIEQPAGITFRELLGRVRDTVIGAAAHQELPFEHLVRALQPARSARRMALFQVNFRVQNLGAARPAFAGLDAEPVDIDNGTSKFDLACEMEIDGGALGGYVEYSADLFDEATAARIAADFKTMLGAVAANPDAELTDLYTA